MSGKSIGFVASALAVLSVTTLVAQKSFAWGKEGHEAIALIAQQNFTADTKSKVSAILGDYSITDASTWADRIKRVGPWEHTKPYHFADMIDSEDYLTMLNNLPADKRQAGDVVRALVKSEDILRSASSSQLEKQNALKFMIHFVGDLHQPLHQGRPADKGGNEIEAVYFNVKTNLHYIWDDLIISNFMKGVGDANVNAFDPLATEARKKSTKPTNPSSPSHTTRPPKASDDPAEYVARLRTPSASEIQQWQNSYLLDWSADSKENRADIYGDWNGSNSQEYQNHFAEIANTQILRAGYRLGAWLNAIFAGEEYQSDKAADLRQHLAQVLGPNYDDTIVLVEKTAKDAGGLSSEQLAQFDCKDDD